MLGTIIGNVDRITLGIDIGTKLVFLYGSFDGSNDGKLGVLLIGDSLGFIDVKVIGSDEGIKLIFTDGKVIILVSNMKIPITTATDQLHLS